MISKIFEKINSKQITNVMDPLLSKYQSWFRRGFSAQNCLLALLEKWKSSVDKGKAFGVLLTDLSKAFDCLSHELIIAKLNAYGFSLSALKLMQSYLSERKQRTKINQAYSSWEEILIGDLYLVRFYLTFFLVIRFLLCMMLILQIMLTATQFMMQVTILMRSLYPCQNPLKNFLNGSLIIRWKLMKTIVI